jgi:hypothetical protein
MPSLAPYIPNREAVLNNWLSNFSTKLTASPATYGLSAADATAVSAQVALWAAAYALITSPSTKSPANVQAKNIVRVQTLALIRPYAQLISQNAGVTASNKTAIGVSTRTNPPTPITTPTTTPILSYVSGASLHGIFRYRDSVASPSVKAKPYGVIQIQIFAMTSTTAVTDPTLLPQIAVTTKSPFTLTWPSADLGARVYMAARYVTRTGKVGPFSPILSFTVS